jgi:dTDP-4-dehydrorhamnose 3,5-epimerase-like enzyme
MPNCINGGLSVDDRGTVRFVNDFKFENVKRFYHVSNHSKGFIRAWHGHKISDLYVYVVKGTIFLATMTIMDDIIKTDINKFILSDLKPQILHIPANHYNGFKTLTEDCQILFYSTIELNNMQDDDIRKYYDYGVGKIFWDQEYR